MTLYFIYDYLLQFLVETYKMKRANENNNDERIERKTRKRSRQNCEIDYNNELVRCNHCEKLSLWSQYHCELVEARPGIQNLY